MAGEGYGRAGRITLYLVVLNVLTLGIGLGLQYVAASRMPGFGEFNSEKIHFWSQPESYHPVAATPKPVAETAPAVQNNKLCLLVDEMSEDNFQELEGLMKSSSLDEASCSYGFDKKLGWWVFWPPEYEASRREKALQSIHAAGVKDVLPITQGAMAQSFSVGVFISGSQARQYRNSLRSKGLDKIEYGPRPGIGPVRLGCVSNDSGSISRFKASLPVWAKSADETKCF